jgi:hypothetical protein
MSNTASLVRLRVVKNQKLLVAMRCSPLTRSVSQTHRPEGEADDLYPVWKKTLDQDFDLDSEIHNVVLTGALGIGKTTVLVLIILYRLCVSTMLRNPRSSSEQAAFRGWCLCCYR